MIHSDIHNQILPSLASPLFSWKRVMNLPEKQCLNFFNPNRAVKFQSKPHFVMPLYDVNQPLINKKKIVCHQLDRIGLFEHFDDQYGIHKEGYECYKRFCIEEDKAHLNFSSGEHMEIPMSRTHSPLKQTEAPIAGEIQEHLKQNNPEADQCKLAKWVNSQQKLNGSTDLLSSVEAGSTELPSTITKQQAYCAIDWEEIITGVLFLDLVTRMLLIFCAIRDAEAKEGIQQSELLPTGI